MNEVKHLTIRVDIEKWQKAKLKMVQEAKGETFQSLFIKALDEYLQEDEKENKKSLDFKKSM